ncbi:MAG TPA: amidohydrolase family protein [Thermoanaerobaculia bacterium]|jgi:imidazolonepropionase-like amidohydrolase
MTLALALSALLLGVAGPPQQGAAPARPVALVGATLIDGTGSPPMAHATLVVRDGLIECAGRDCKVPKGAVVTDLTGAWIAPGLIDAHVHFGQTGWADGRPDAFDVRDRYPYENVASGLARNPERFLRTQLCSGLTSVFDVGGYPWSIDMAHRERDDPNAPRVAAAGPLLSTIDFWLNLPAERQFIHLKDADAGRLGVRYLAARGADAVKIWFIVTPEQTVEASTPAVLAAGEEARKLGIPLVVHATGLAEAKVALKAGAHMLVHSVDDQPVDDEFLSLAKANGVVYCPTITVYGGYARLGRAGGAAEPPAVDDPNGCVDAETLAKIKQSVSLPKTDPERLTSMDQRVAKATAQMAANLKRMSEAGITVAMGTDAGNPLTLHGPSIYGEMEAMQAAGMTPMQVLVAATRGGSLAMGVQKLTGTLEKGKWADAIVLAADPTADIANCRRLRSVMRAGVLHPIDELHSLAQ